MGGFMPTPPAPAQPPQVKLDTTATSRGNFSTFLKNMNGATSLNPPSMAPSVGAATPTLAPTMSDIDIFNSPVQMMKEGGGVPPRNVDIMGQPHMLAYITPSEGDLLESLGGANEPGPMGIPSFAFGDPDAEDVDEAGAGEGTSEAEVSAAQEASGGYGFEPDADQEDSARGGDYTVDDDNVFSGYGASYGKSLQDAVKSNPQLQGFLGKKISNLIDKGKVQDFEFNKQGQLTGVYGRSQVPGAVGGIMSLLGIPTTVTTYTGYGKGFDDMLGGGDDNDDPLLRKLPSEKKEEEEIKDKPPNQIGGIEPITGTPTVTPTVVASPFAPATSNIEPIGFDSGELNKLIELLTGVPAKPVVAAKEGGLIKAVDDFLATGT